MPVSSGFQAAVVSHRTGNIGHALMAVGAEEIVREAHGSDGVRVTHLAQHRPFDIYPPWSPLRALNVLPESSTVSGRFVRGRLAELALAARDAEPTRRFARRIAWGRPARALWRFARVTEFDVVLTCGGPNIVPWMSRSPLLALLHHHMYGAVTANGVPLLSLAVGTAFPHERVPERLDAENSRFLARSLEAATVTTVRDELARRLCADAGWDCPLLPCTALLCGVRWERGRAPAPESSRYVLANYQLRGANDDWGTGVQTDTWRRTVRELLDRLRTRHEVAMLAHDTREEQWAAELAPELPVFRPRTPEEYADVAAGAKAGLVSRIHGALPLAGVGAPAVVVGTDTRLGAIETMGLPTVYVKEATADLLEHELERLLSARDAERERLLALRAETLARYAALVRSVVAGPAPAAEPRPPGVDVPLVRSAR